MPTYEDTQHAGIVHTFHYMNKERRAGLTYCGMYVEFRPTTLLETAPTCVLCVGYIPPRCECPLYRKGVLIAGHRAYCPVVEGFDAVEERIEDVVRDCVNRGTHNAVCDADGFCQACGYQFDDSNVRLLRDV